MRSALARALRKTNQLISSHLDHHRRDRLPAEDPRAADRELALVVLEDAHGPEGVLARVVDALEEAADLVHDDEVDGVLVDVPGERRGVFFPGFSVFFLVSFFFFIVVSEALPGRRKKQNRARRARLAVLFPSIVFVEGEKEPKTNKNNRSSIPYL